MNSERQFSLAYLLLQTMWVALALGLSRVWWMSLRTEAELFALVLACTCYGIALGGLFRGMRVGALLGLAVGIVLAVVSLTDRRL